jgi:hypothetical protein
VRWVWVILVAAAVAGLVTLFIVGPLPAGYACVTVHGHTVCGGEVAP